MAVTTIADAPAAPDANCLNVGPKHGNFKVIETSIVMVGYCLAKHIKSVTATIAIYFGADVGCHAFDFIVVEIDRAVCGLPIRTDLLNGSKVLMQKIHDLVRELDATTAKLDKLQKCIELSESCAGKQLRARKNHSDVEVFSEFSPTPDVTLVSQKSRSNEPHLNHLVRELRR